MISVAARRWSRIPLRPAFRTIRVAGGSTVAGEFLRRGLVVEIRCTILPIVIGDGMPFFTHLDHDVAFHLAEVTAYRTGMVELRYEVRGSSTGQTPPT